LVQSILTTVVDDVDQETHTVDHKAMSEQVLVEHEVLAHIVSALRATVDWKYQGADLTRKIGSLRFVGQSLQRHLKHLMGLEEHDGYMSAILESHPELNDEVEALRQEHGQFRKALSRILTRLRLVKPTDHSNLAEISDELLALLKKLDEHSHKETGLIQHALLKEEGGEG
jgi:hemerythrin-like domain-containing protein